MFIYLFSSLKSRTIVRVSHRDKKDSFVFFYLSCSPIQTTVYWWFGSFGRFSSVCTLLVYFFSESYTKEISKLSSLTTVQNGDYMKCSIFYVMFLVRTELAVVEPWWVFGCCPARPHQSTGRIQGSCHAVHPGVLLGERKTNRDI